MADQRLMLFQSLVDAILTTPGETDPALRSALAQATANQTSPLTASISPECAAYVKKVVLHAYRVTDQDIDSLRANGYSEDAIFEITLSVALGTGMNCLTQGFSAIMGARDALKED